MFPVTCGQSSSVTVRPREYCLPYIRFFGYRHVNSCIRPTFEERVKLDFDKVNQRFEFFPATSFDQRPGFPQSFKDTFREVPGDSAGIHSSLSGSIHPDLNRDQDEERGGEGNNDL